MRIGGIDEAGRGPVIGPMIICGYVLDERKIPELERLGVRDSKEMAKEEREEIFQELVKIADELYLEAIKPREIDRFVEMNIGLNKLELMKFSSIIKRMGADEIYVDSPYRNSKKVEEELRKATGKNVIALVKADKRIPVVSAASVVAKVIRDRFIEILKREYGDFGSGYPSDPKTVEFLRKNIGRIEDSMIRKSWETYKRLSQKSLLDFM